MKESRKIRKIMLIFPTGKVLKGHFHHCELPMGLAYLAAVIRSDFEVKVLDARASFETFSPRSSKWEYFGLRHEEIIREIKNFSPDAVGVSCLSSFHFPETRAICAAVKEFDPGMITIIGGTHPTFLAEEVMSRHQEIDFIVLGEGEEVLRELLGAINSGKDYAALDGLAFRKNGSVVVNPKTKFIPDLDKLPFPALDMFPLDFYAQKSIPFSVTFRSRKTAPILTSRGCAAACVFCASQNYWGRRYRMRSPENVLQELEILVNKFGFREIQFIDDNLTLDKDRARKIFEGIIERKLNISWNTPNGIAVWTLDEAMLELMKKSGCYELTVAFESGVQEVLDKIIKKPLNLQKAALLVKKMKALDIQVHSFFISGFPGETREQIKKTFEFAWKMDLDSAWFFVANPTPGSRLYELCREKGYIREDFSFEDIEYSIPHITTEDFTPRQVEKLVLSYFTLYNIGQLFRHPVRFMKKYFTLIITHPGMVLRSVWADVSKVIAR